MQWNFIWLPATGAIIGFLTNWIAIQFLFKPRKKILGIQGIIPKRKEAITEQIAEVSLNFLPSKIEKLTKIPYLGKKILEIIKKGVGDKIQEMDDAKLEKIVRQIASKEFKFIEISGAIIGAIIGIIQATILLII